MTDETTTDEPKKRPYTMSPEALEQRRAASLIAREHATGPKTEEGKAASCRNNWRHGLRSAAQGQKWLGMSAVTFGKPCRTTCAKFPCDIVNEGDTAPGGDCLDKSVYMDAFADLMQVLQSGDASHGNEMLAAQLAGAIEMVQQLREEIAENGVSIKIPMTTKEGAVIYDKDGKAVIGDVKVNPALFHYSKLLADLGINLPELMATPRAAAKKEDGENAADAIASLFSQALTRNGGKPVRRPVVIEQPKG